MNSIRQTKKGTPSPRFRLQAAGARFSESPFSRLLVVYFRMESVVSTFFVAS